VKVSVKVFTGAVTDRELEIAEGSTYFDMLGVLKINPETVVIFNGGVPVAFDAPVVPVEIKIMRVVSGG
jgi:sulfur carrier protein